MQRMNLCTKFVHNTLINDWTLGWYGVDYGLRSVQVNFLRNTLLL